MRAAVPEAPSQDLVVMDDVEIKGPGWREMRLRVAHRGVCHADLFVIRPGRQRPSLRGWGRGQPSGRHDGVRRRARHGRESRHPLPVVRGDHHPTPVEQIDEALAHMRTGHGIPTVLEIDA